MRAGRIRGWATNRWFRLHATSTQKLHQQPIGIRSDSLPRRPYTDRGALDGSRFQHDRGALDGGRGRHYTVRQPKGRCTEAWDSLAPKLVSARVLSRARHLVPSNAIGGKPRNTRRHLRSGEVARVLRWYVARSWANNHGLNKHALQKRCSGPPIANSGSIHGDVPEDGRWSAASVSPLFCLLDVAVPLCPAVAIVGRRSALPRQADLFLASTTT